MQYCITVSVTCNIVLQFQYSYNIIVDVRHIHMYISSWQCIIIIQYRETTNIPVQGKILPGAWAEWRYRTVSRCWLISSVAPHLLGGVYVSAVYQLYTSVSAGEDLAHVVFIHLLPPLLHVVE